MTGAFDHLAAGTDESGWVLDDLDRLTPPGRGARVLVLAAHPDDETLGAGGLLALCARRDVAVTVVIATDGEASHPDSPTTTPAQLADRRRTEVQAAVAALVPGGAVRFLGLPDGQLYEHRAALQAQVTHFADDCTLIVSPWSGDRHPDHESCALAAAEVARQRDVPHWQYPIWLWHWAQPGDDAVPTAELARLDLDPDARSAKARALDCHVSQHSPLSDRAGDEAILPARMLAHFTRPFECFVAADRHSRTTPPAVDFEALYEQADDPWELADRFYEQRKRDVVLAALPRPRFHRVFEPGCATGLLTAGLAARADNVVAWDLTDRALDQTRARVSGMPVTVHRGRIPDEWPDGRFDLVMLSEVGYYCTDLHQLVERTLQSLTDDGVVLACHWRHPAPGHAQSAQAVHRVFEERLSPVVTHVEDDFLLHVWTRTGHSVARETGILHEDAR